MTEHTPGPWAWFTNSHGPYLATPDRGHLLVMDFARKGMNGAQPRFAIWKGEKRERMGGLMRRAEELNLGDHPDANLIAAAPDLLAACEAVLQIGIAAEHPVEWSQVVNAVAKARGVK